MEFFECSPFCHGKSGGHPGNSTNLHRNFCKTSLFNMGFEFHAKYAHECVMIETNRHLLFLDSFVNSQEWTLSRSVPDIRLGIVGSLSSGKSALVHRYLTGSYMQEESPEGGRFKKEVVVDGQSYLLLIRDEGGPPELQVR